MFLLRRRPRLYDPTSTLPDDWAFQCLETGKLEGLVRTNINTLLSRHANQSKEQVRARVYGNLENAVTHSVVELMNQQLDPSDKNHASDLVDSIVRSVMQVMSEAGQGDSKIIAVLNMNEQTTDNERESEEEEARRTVEQVVTKVVYEKTGKVPKLRRKENNCVVC